MSNFDFQTEIIPALTVYMISRGQDGDLTVHYLADGGALVVYQGGCLRHTGRGTQPRCLEYGHQRATATKGTFTGEDMDSALAYLLGTDAPTAAELVGTYGRPVSHDELRDMRARQVERLASELAEARRLLAQLD